MENYGWAFLGLGLGEFVVRAQNWLDFYEMGKKGKKRILFLEANKLLEKLWIAIVFKNLIVVWWVIRWLFGRESMWGF